MKEVKARAELSRACLIIEGMTQQKKQGLKQRLSDFLTTRMEWSLS